MSLLLSTLCRDLFMMSFAARFAGAIGGRQWEERVQDYLALRSVPVEVLPGGSRVFGMTSLSGLRHQVDVTLGASDALVIAEFKAYRNALPKNEILKFKAVTEDYYVAIGAALPKRPVIRIFGGPGEAGHELRRYAAYHGIVLIERRRWPVPVILSEGGGWPGVPAVPADEAASLARLCRPMQRTLLRQPDGAYRVAAFPPTTAIDAMLALHDRWSDWMWGEVDAMSGAFEEMLERRFRQIAHVA